MNAEADLMFSDNFSASPIATTGTSGFRLEERHVDQGWQGARQGGGTGWTTTNGTMANSSTVNTDGYPNYIPGEAAVAQSISGTSACPDTDTQICISFEYDIAVGDTFFVQFWGHTGTFSTTSNARIGNIESRYGMGNNEAPAGNGTTTLDAFNLLNGATGGFGGNSNAFAVLAGGTSGTFTGTVDLATLGIAGVSKVNDLAVLSMSFGKQEDGLAGTTFIDDLTITTKASSVPEPGSIALFGLAAVAVGLRRRK